MPTSGKNLINGLRYALMLKDVARLVVVTILTWATLTKDANVTFEEYFTKVLKLSTTKCNFNTPQKPKIKNSCDFADFDETLLAKCLELVCKHDPNWTDCSKVLDYNKQVKDLRNDYAHATTISLTDKQLDDKMMKLTNVLTNSLDAAKATFKRDDSELDSKKSEMKNKLLKIRQSIFGKDDRLAASLDDIIKEGKKELETILKKFKTFDPLHAVRDTKWELQVAKLIYKVMIKRADASGKKEELEYYKLLSAIKPGESKPQILMIEGQAGIGKTMLLQHVAQDWLDGSLALEGLDKYNLVLRVLCRETHIQSFEDLIKKMMPNFCSKYQDLALDIIKNCRLMVTVDGLDEQTDQSKKLLQNLLDELQDIPSCTILCTSRPESIPDFKRKAGRYIVREAELLGIAKEERPQFLLRYFNACHPNESTDKLLQVCGKVLHQEHYGKPINLVFLVWKFIEDPSSIKEDNTPTDFYDWVQQLGLQKLKGRLTGCSLDMSALKQLVCEDLGLVMLQDLARNQLILSPQAINQFKSACEARRLTQYKEVLSAFLVLTRDSSHMQDKETFSAPHKGMQEYLASMYVVSKFINAKGHRTIKSILKNAVPELPSNSINLIQHIAGALYQQMDANDARRVIAASEVVELLHQAGVMATRDWIALLEDTKCSPALLQAIVPHIHDKFIDVTDGTLKSWCKLLPHLEQREVLIDLDGDPSPLANLSLDCLHHRYMGVELFKYFRHPDQTTNIGVLDNFLHHILPRNDLEKFTGPLTAVVSSSLSTTITWMKVSVNSDSQAALLPNLNNLTNLTWLDVHVTKEVSPAALTCPLPAVAKHPGYSRVDLYISDVDFSITDSVNRAVNIAVHLQPSCGYYVICFPLSATTYEGLKTLVVRLGCSSVRVLCALIIPHTNITTITEDQEQELTRLITTKLGAGEGLHWWDNLSRWERPQP